MPDFSFELSLGGERIAGIDEAGRGPLAGPVVAAAVMLDPERLSPELTARLDDSKKLPRKVRETLFGHVSARAAVGIGIADVEEIDRHNILQATLLAMQRAFEAMPEPALCAIVDGNRAPELGCPTRCLVAGDSRSLSVAAASIVAKVTRDRIMAALAAECPGYGWERNFGYGTREHREALAKLGVTRHHRRCFAPVAAMLK